MLFNPEMLILARESRGLSQSNLSDLTAVRQGTISKVEGGALPPSTALLETLARVLQYPEEFFTQTDSVYGFNSTVFFHRKRQSLPDRVLRRLHAQMNITRMRIKRLLRSYPLESIVQFRAMSPSEYDGGVTGVARLVRSSWLLPPGPVRSVTEAIENAGGIVVPFDFDTRQADAISEWIHGFPPIFLVNTNAEVPGDRLRLTLAHEVAHIVMHDAPGTNIEEEANEFAAEFLMPRREIKGSLFALNMSKLATHKLHWKVSMAALIHRAYELGTITESQRRYLYINLAKRSGGRIHEPLESHIPREEPKLFNRIVQQHLNELGYSIRELARMLFFLDEGEFRRQFLQEMKLRLVN